MNKDEILLKQIEEKLLEVRARAEKGLACHDELQRIWLVWAGRVDTMGRWSFSLNGITTTEARAAEFSKTLRDEEKAKETPYRIYVEQTRLDHLFGFQDLESTWRSGLRG